MEDTIDYSAVFGIDAQGAEAREVAEPVSDTAEAQGVEAPELAEPDEQPTENDTSPAEPTGEETTQETDGAGVDASASDTDEEQEQTASGEKEGTRDIAFSSKKKERDAQFAAARRKAEAERDAAVQRAKEEAQAEARRTIDEAFRNSGLTNPYTGTPITSKAEYDAYMARLASEKKDRILKKSGMTDEEWGQFVEGLPQVREAKQARAAAEAAAEQARQQQARLKVDEELKEIGALDPSIKELKDIAKLETYPKFYELVKKGNSLVDAFKLANYDALTSSTAAASRQAAINAAQSKRHLSQTAQRGAGAVTVPSEVKEAYRAFNPGATEAEIQQHYNKYLKK